MNIYTNMSQKALQDHNSKFKRVAEDMRIGLFRNNDDVNKAVDHIITELEHEICSRKCP